MGVWEPTPPSPSFSKPPLLSGPRFFLQLEEDAEEVITSQDTSCGTGLDPSQAGRYNGSAGLSPTRPPRSLSSREDDSQTSRASGTGPAAQARRQDGGWSGIKARPSAMTQQCELCDSAPSSHTWAVKGGWLRKARNRVKASGAESNQSSPLQLASNWRRGTTHQLCSGCKAWAFEIASHGEDSTQNTVTSPEPWARLTEILMLEPAQAMLPKSAQLLEWIEEHEKAFTEGSLEHWVAYRIATCLEEELEDVEAIRTVAAQLQVPRKQTGRKDFCFLVANITTHRREIHSWINQQEGDVFALQETHLLPQPLKEAQINYDRGKWSTIAIPAHDTGKGTSGGLMLGAKTHVNMREGPRFSIQGKGFLFGIFRFPGYDIAVGTVYLESGVGPDSGLNPAILSELISVIKTFACCWVLAGDWNCSWEDLQKSAFPRLVRAGVIVPAEATTTQGSTLDYALCSRELVGLLAATVIWDVPFRPHAGILYNLQVSGLGTPLLQSKVFTRECLQQPRDLPRPPDPSSISFLLEATSLHPRDTSWGGFVRWLEATTCEDGKQGAGLEG